MEEPRKFSLGLSRLAKKFFSFIWWLLQARGFYDEGSATTLPPRFPFPARDINFIVFMNIYINLHLRVLMKHQERFVSMKMFNKNLSPRRKKEDSMGEIAR